MIGILGVDPGLTGALALCRDGQWVLLDMPIAGDAKHYDINGPELCRWLREQKPDHAFIEYAAARPGQGVTSMFRFGCTYGALKMALAACGVPYTIIAPAKWKPAVGVLKGADKEASRLRALQLFPDQTANLQRKKDHARADAMLLAFYGLHHSGGATVFHGDDRSSMLLSSAKPHRNAINLRE
jgi:crossover junction endodeoxyribonuclease RuvC